MNQFLHRYASSLSIIILSCCLLSSLSCGKRTYNEPDIAALLNEYREALSSKSPEQIAAVYHEDAVIMAPDKGPVRGRENIIEHFEGLRTMDFRENFQVQEILQAGEYIIVETDNTGEYSKLNSGDKGTFEVKGQMVLKTDNEGNLKIFRYAYSSNTPPDNTSPEDLEGKFVHTVLFWLARPDSAQLHDEFETALKKFINASPNISRKHIGTPADTDRPIIDNTYDYCLVVSFENKEAHDKYQAEPAHEVFRRVSENMLAKVLIYDSVAP